MSGKQILTALVVGTVVVGGCVLISNLKDPLDGKAPSYVAYLTEEKTLCESTAQQLIAKGIDGRAEYTKAQAAANAAVGHLQGVLAQGNGDEKQISDSLDRLNKASFDFRDWATQKLGMFGAEKKGFDPVAAAAEVMKLLNAQEQARRKAVSDLLEKCKFRSWAELGGQ